MANFTLVASPVPSETLHLITYRSLRKSSARKSARIRFRRFSSGYCPATSLRCSDFSEILHSAPTQSRLQNDKQPPLRIATTFEIRLSTVGKVFPLSGNDRLARNVQETPATRSAKMGSYNPTEDQVKRQMHRPAAMKIIRDAERKR